MLMSKSSRFSSTSSKSMLKIWISVKINLFFNRSQTSSAIWLSTLFVTFCSVMLSRVFRSTYIRIVGVVTQGIGFTHTIWRCWTNIILGSCVSGHLNGLTDEVVVSKFLVDSIEHTLMFRFLVIDLVSHHDKVFVIFEHTISVSSVILWQLIIFFGCIFGVILFIIVFFSSKFFEI